MAFFALFRRPFGTGAMFAGYDSVAKTHQLYVVEPSGVRADRAYRGPRTKRRTSRDDPRKSIREQRLSLSLSPGGLVFVSFSQVSLRYFGCALGKGRQSAKSEIEKLDLTKLTTESI